MLLQLQLPTDNGVFLPRCAKAPQLEGQTKGGLGVTMLQRRNHRLSKTWNLQQIMFCLGLPDM